MAAYKKKLNELQKEQSELIQIKQKNGKIVHLTENQKKLINLHRDIANVPLSDPNMVTQSENFLGFLYPFDGLKWVQGYFAKTHKESIEQMITRVREYGYYKYWAGLYELTGKLNKTKASKFIEKAAQFLQEGVALGDQKAMNDLYQHYRKNNQFVEATKVCKILAEEYGRKELMHNLATHYLNGEGVEKDSEKAFEWHTKAADKGMHMAILGLIKEFWHKEGPKKDLKKSFEWSKFLVENGKMNGEDRDRATSLVLLARCYFYGQGVNKNHTEGFKYFQEAAILGEKNALIHMAMAYQYGNGVGRDLESAIKYWESVAARYPNELVHAGLCYDSRAFELKNEGKDQKAVEYFKKAYKYYQDAAKEKDAQAIYNIACHHSHGTFCKKNLDFAKEWFTKAVKLGHVEAMASLGKINLFGNIKNFEEAEKWLTEAADKGSSDAMLDLGWFYGTIKKDNEKSLSWYKKAAALGNPAALYSCGAILLSSASENNDEKPALSYLQQSAEKGYSRAMTLLGKYYLERSDTETEKGQENSESAYFWLKKSADLGNFEAITLLKEAENERENENPSEDLEKCLKNLEKIEKGELEGQTETKTINEKRSSPFDIITDEDFVTDSSDEEGEIGSESSSNTKEENLETPHTEVTPVKKDVIKNPKFLREQMRKAGLAFKEKEENSQKSEEIKLDPKSCEIINMLKSKKQREQVTYGTLYKLFSDPYFKAKGNIELQKTKSGLSISAKHFGKMESILAEDDSTKDKKVMTTGTHHNHNKTYKGYNPEFLKNVVSILEMFGV
ncbi:MAG: sel1 repeat family protein [Alphaproteobacteria bacterium]|nr:sel1 repeat family protein [Alphaproteobacteria bacterium]